MTAIALIGLWASGVAFGLVARDDTPKGSLYRTGATMAAMTFGSLTILLKHVNW